MHFLSCTIFISLEFRRHDQALHLTKSIYVFFFLPPDDELPSTLTIRTIRNYSKKNKKKKQRKTRAQIYILVLDENYTQFMTRSMQVLCFFKQTIGAENDLTQCLACACVAMFMKLRITQMCSHVGNL